MPNQRKSPIKFEADAADPQLKKKEAASSPPPLAEGAGEGTADESLGGVQRPPSGS